MRRWLVIAGMVVLVGVPVGAWLWWRGYVNQAYGRATMVQALDLLEEGRIPVVQYVTSQGVFPKSAEQIGFEPVDRRFGPEDRNVRMRSEVLPGGAVAVHLDGWQFQDAIFRLVPFAEGKELGWRCEVSNIPRNWVDPLCFQIEQQRVRLGFDPSAPIPGAAAADGSAAADESVEGGAEPTVSTEPAAWGPPFQSRAPLTGRAAEVAEGLRLLAPFQQAVQEYYLANSNTLPMAAGQIESQFTEAQTHFAVGGERAAVGFGPNGTMYLLMKDVSLALSPTISADDDSRIVWTCWKTTGGDVALPPECGRQ